MSIYIYQKNAIFGKKIRIFLYFFTCEIDFFFKKVYNDVMEKYQYKQQFEIRYRDVDFKDEMKASAALTFMEEVAGASADELGFGYRFLKPNGYAFVVSNTCIEFIRPIALFEKITLKTWPLPPTYATFQREYFFEDEKGARVAAASSRWCLLDCKNGKILPSKCIEGQDYSTYNTDKALENVQWKLPKVDIQEQNPDFVITIANSEYDHNLHVNNTRYCDYALNCFTLAQLREKRIKKLSLTYAKQCYEGETLRFYKTKLADSSFIVQGLNQANERVIQVQIVFA